MRGLANGTNGEVGYVTFGETTGQGLKPLLLTEISTVPSPSHPATAAGDYFSYTNFSRLFSLSHQSFEGMSLQVKPLVSLTHFHLKGLHPFKDATADGRFPTG